MAAAPSDVFAPPARDVAVAGLDELDSVQRGALLDYWRSRADAEWTTMEALDHVRQDLLALGAPGVLVDLAAHAVADEKLHSIWCHAMAERIGGRNFDAPKLRGSDRLAFPAATEAENRLLRPLFAGCLSETIAVCVLRVNRDGIAPGFIREAQRVHLSDEISHSRLGWAFLAHAQQSGWLGDKQRCVVREALPMMCELAKRFWASGDVYDDEQLAALGYLTRSQIRAGIDTAFEEVIEPAFAEHGFAVGEVGAA